METCTALDGSGAFWLLPDLRLERLNPGPEFQFR